MKKNQKSLKNKKPLTLHRETVQLLQVHGQSPTATCYGHTCVTNCAASYCCP